MTVRIILWEKKDPLNNLILKDVTRIEKNFNSVTNKDIYVFFYSDRWAKCEAADVETLIIEE